jgi:hypothetical protein
MLLEVLKQGSAGTMHDALGHPGGARRVHDEQGMVERQPDKGNLGDRQERPDEFGQHAGVMDMGQIVMGVHIGHHNNPLHRGQTFGDGGQPIQAVHDLAVVIVAIHGHQHLGLDLPEAIQHPLHTEIR